MLYRLKTLCWKYILPFCRRLTFLTISIDDEQVQQMKMKMRNVKMNSHVRLFDESLDWSWSKKWKVLWYVFDDVCVCVNDDGYYLQMHRLTIDHTYIIVKYKKVWMHQFNSIQYYSIPFNSIQFHSIPFNSIQFHSYDAIQSGPIDTFKYMCIVIFWYSSFILKSLSVASHWTLRNTCMNIIAYSIIFATTLATITLHHGAACAVELSLMILLIDYLSSRHHALISIDEWQIYHLAHFFFLTRTIYVIHALSLLQHTIMMRRITLRSSIDCS
jgi:hypothetical protein